ncbi:alpha/beta hydrolase [Delftia sp. HK171]|jgi:predicted alpha/beta hydrolase family esterase|uniref:RBBP9/YdeN family alpha/beta hydrolase n=1 Tax=Delftia TaxID=80865 RepID=UPI000903152F|nr:MULTISPECIES: alpha/beta hydrolase [Delftia]APE46845.1 alpha/beta hydrolase [Delftia sp. HK171]MBD9584559.1 serine hydrolase family protein [Delftia sp. DLF01]OWG13339.1 alpha/beta hydrolase [Delftia sp. K82]QPR36310.1 serine hydrolase family protein [Delftia acidovorans]
MQGSHEAAGQGVPTGWAAEDVWLLPGWQNSDADHWQSRWEQRHGYRRLEQNDWDRPLRGDWSARLQETVLDAPRPVVLVAHSLGCILVAWWAAHSPLAARKVRGALLVAPGDTEQPQLREQLPGWSPVMMQRLPFASIVVGSDNDIYCSAQRVQAMADAWGARFVDAGPSGHLNTASGLGDWDSGHALLASL